MRYQVYREHLNHGSYLIAEFETLEEAENAMHIAESFAYGTGWHIDIYDTEG